MYTHTDAPLTAPRIPRQAPGVSRGAARPSAVAAGGVEAAGIFSWLGDLLGLPSDVGSTLDTLGNIGLSFVPGGSAIGQALSPYVP